jgi:hypothetical protein
MAANWYHLAHSEAVYTSVIDDVTLLTSYVSVEVTVGDNVKFSTLKFFMKPILFFVKFEFNNYF